MASTYSTNLRTELIGSGDQAGTWGTTTNTTLGTILEQAVAGVSGGPAVGGTYPAVNFPTDADLTLTANNGAIDQSRSAVLVVTSSFSLTATRNIIAPASASKVYIIKNSTTGVQSIQIKYATGTGVLIPNGTTATVYGDGTNFYSASSSGIPTGAIQMWSTVSAPIGFLICDGSAISRTAFAELFSVVGTTFGAGDGSTTFNLPNYTNRMPYGAAIGTTGGADTTTLITANLPSHTHTFSVTTSGSGTTAGQNANHTHSGTTGGMNASNPHNHIFNGSGDDFGGGFVGQGSGNPIATSSTDINHGHDFSTGGVSSDHAHGFSVTTSGSGTTAGTGSGTSFTNLSPYLGINFIIKT
jgi:microcystin-dependent protein